MNADWGVRFFLAIVVILWALTPPPEEEPAPMFGWVRTDRFGLTIDIPLLNKTRMMQLGLRQDGVCMWRLLPEGGK